jgi:hypothetical protein
MANDVHVSPLAVIKKFTLNANENYPRNHDPLAFQMVHNVMLWKAAMAILLITTGLPKLPTVNGVVNL